ncbi:MAG: helix-turn-helix domain-containing protein [Pseudonocardiaceae bacterium]|nr:helix-turn-helix domain-containing protein [Pseudonocardiaceae bacterium]
MPSQSRPSSETVIAFGRRVAETRRKVGMGQEKLARRAHIHVTAISSIERGVTNTGLENVVRIVQALGVSAAELLDDLPAPPVRDDHD